MVARVTSKFFYNKRTGEDKSKENDYGPRLFEGEGRPKTLTHAIRYLIFYRSFPEFIQIYRDITRISQ